MPAGLSITVRTPAAAAVDNAVVVIDPLDGMPPPSHDKGVIDQIDKRFVPKISVVRTGTSVSFPNSDQIRHQVYSFSPAKPFTLKLYAGSPNAGVVFDKPGLVVLGCNIHDNMAAFVLVVDTPYFVRMPASGTAKLELPPGHYRVRLWHPGLSAPFTPQDLTVGADAASLALVAVLGTDRDAIAAWP